MKVCYVDESGSRENDPCFVMVGILVDASRLNRTRVEFAGIFDKIQGLFEENLQELKGAKLIFGRDRWRRIDSETRKIIVEELCNWLTKRKHHVLVSGIERSKFQEAPQPVPGACRDIWLAAGLHIALQIQKANKKAKNNKGQTFLIFDENKAKADHIAELLWKPPEWTDDYYDREPKQERLDQLIDSAFAVRSHHAGLVQVADVYALIIRRYIEFRDFSAPEEWAGERHLIEHYVGILESRLFPVSNRYPQNSRSEAAKWYNSIAPDSLLKLGKKNND
jgi:hypothetical protein